MPVRQGSSECHVGAPSSRRKQSEFHAPQDKDDEEEDTVLPVFGNGSNAQKMSTPPSNIFQIPSLRSRTEKLFPREHRRLPMSPLCISREPDNIPGASNSDPTASANLTAIEKVQLSPPRDNLGIPIPKLTIAALERDSPSGIEICFGDPLLSDDAALSRGITQLDRFPVFSGSNSSIYRVNLIRSDGQHALLAMKQIRVHSDDLVETDSLMRRLKREVEIWSQLKHPNILPFLGVYDIGAPLPVFLSPFCQFGHMGNYLKTHPLANRRQLMHGVAFGLKYLHNHNIVHGDLKLANILVDKRHVPCICDFGISRIVGQAGFTTYSMGSTAHLAPELFAVLDIDGGNTELTPPRPTSCSDVYSFACLALDILNPSPPPAKMGTPFVTHKGLNDLRPDRAAYSVDSISHELWLVLDKCWMVDPHLRPTMEEILASPAFGVTQDYDSLIVPKLMLRAFSPSEGDGDEIAFGDHCLRFMPGDVRSLAKQNKIPRATAGYWDIFRAKLDLSGSRRIQVVIKTLEPNFTEDPAQVQELTNSLNRQSHVWTKLRHANVLPFLGLYDVGEAMPILIWPFCEFGHVRHYLRNYSQVNRKQLVHDVASGLKYLHDLDIVHGNLKVENILIDKRGVACITDFEIFRTMDLLGFSIPGRTASELVHHERKSSSFTKMSDMYSFALVALEILTVEPLRERASSDAPVETAQIFLRPTVEKYGVDAASPSTWIVLHQCRNSNPELRPTIAEILESPQFFDLGR
ncbi:kinase-like domain-containing protein [Mycena haematopus]|nr:kinase-like domain-containing protein [Mycena haematopus]